MTMKRANGSGSITPIKATGRHRVRIWHPPSAEHPKGRRESLGSYTTLEEAESVLRGALDLYAAGAVTPAGKKSILSFEVRYFELRSLRARDHKAAREKHRYAKHLRAAPFAAKPLPLVETVEVQRWIDALATTEADDDRGDRFLSQESVKKIVRLLRSVFRYALRDGLIEANPVTRDLELPAPDEREEEIWDYLRPGEQRAVLTCAAIPESVRLWIAFAMGTGLRPSELRRLLLVDVQADAEAPSVRVKKTKINRPRTVPLFGLALAAWRRWLELLPSYAPKNPRGLAWPRPRGGARSGLALPRAGGARHQLHEHEVWRGYLRAAGLDRDLRWYDVTRHTCATSLLCGWWGPRWTLHDVSRVLGHTNTTTTQRYAHVADEVLHVAGAATTATDLAAIFTPVGPPRWSPGPGTRGTPGPIRTGDQRLRRPEEYSLFRWLVGRGGPTLDRGSWIADPVEVLRAIARGDAQAAQAGGRQLAEQVLDGKAGRLARLAHQVLEGGPFMHARLIELCELLDDEAAATKRGVA
jgi:integrase